MIISVFGMGYVGCVTAACLIKQGHSVIGVDVVEEKVKALLQRRWPVFEPGLDALVKKELSLNRLTVTTDAQKAVFEAHVSIICVGTPSLPDGRVDLSYITRTASEIGRALARKKGKHVVLVRSTVPPGTTESILLPPLTGENRSAGLAVGFYPEFLREGSAIEDFFDPSLNVLGCYPDFPVEVIKTLLPDVKTELQQTSIRTAEAIKYANNTFHALKIAFVNEFALFCREYGVDSAEVMDLFCQDTRLNLSPYYLKPGFAFGGSCLPKEISAVIAMAKERKVEPVLFEAILESNELMIRRFVSLVYQLNPASVGYFGITFKPGTDDIRQSPVLKAIEALLSNALSYSRKIRQVVFDREVAVSEVEGRFGQDLVVARDPQELIERSDVIVLGPYKIDGVIQSHIVSSGKPVIDLKWHEVGDKMREYAYYYSLH